MPRSPKISSASIVVGPFAPSTTSDAWTRSAFALVQLVLAGREDEDVARELEQLLVRDPLAAVVAFERAVLRDVGVERGDVEAGLRVEAARDVRDGDDTRAAVVQLGRRDAADVAEALHDARLVRRARSRAAGRPAR